MDRTTLLWTLVAFFGASLVFAYVRRATEGEGAGVTLGAQAATLAVIVVVIAIVVRRLR